MHTTETSQSNWYESLLGFSNVHVILTSTDGKKTSWDHTVFFVTEEHNQAFLQSETPKRK